jgi:hypothetical protein
MASKIDPEYFRGMAAASQGTHRHRGGGVDDILRRLGFLETSVGETRTDVAAIKAQVPHLATKAEISELHAAMIKWIVGTAIACTTAAIGAAFSIARLLS